MSGYDASIRVNTKVDNSDLGELQKDFNKLEKKLDNLYQKGEKLEALGVDKQSRQWKALVYDVAQTEMALADVEERLKTVNTLNAQKGFGKATESAKKLFKVVNDGSKKSNGLLATMSSRLKGIALSLLVFNWITKGFNAMVQAMKAGFQNLAQYSSDYNKAMSELKSEAAQLKNGLAASLEPIVTTMIPYLSRMISWLNRTIETMGQFLAAMQGKSVYTRAKKQAIDYAKSLNNVSKAAKGALASFDQLNVLNSKEESGDTGGEKVGADAFEEASINPEIYTTLEKVKEVMKIIKPLAIAIGVALLAWKIASFLSGLGVAATAVSTIYSIILAIAGMVMVVASYFNMWQDDVDWEGIIGYVAGLTLAVTGLYKLFGPTAAGIAMIVAGVAGFALALKDMTENGMNAQNMTLLLISTVGILAGVFMAFGSTAAVVVGGIMAAISAIAAMVAMAGNGKEAINALRSVCSNFAQFFKKIFAGDIEGALDSLKNAGKDLANVLVITVESIINCIIKGLNWLIDKINSISFDVPDWVPGIGGSKLSPNISRINEVNLPRLAEGAVIQGGKPFVAILGDQRAGQTNIETPLATMVDAFKQAMSESGKDMGGNYTFVAQLDGRTILKETVRLDQMHYKATGKSLFQH